MFFRHIFSEHLKLLAIIVGVTLFILCPIISVLLNFNLIDATSEPNDIFIFLFNPLVSFLAINKVMYIGVTYLIALLVHLFADELINSQTKRSEVEPEVLTNELKANTRAVLICMTNALSVIFNLYIALASLLIPFIIFGGTDFTNSINFKTEDLIYLIVMAILFEFSLFAILKWLVLPCKPPESKQEELNVSNEEFKMLKEEL